MAGIHGRRICRRESNGEVKPSRPLFRTDHNQRARAWRTRALDTELIGGKAAKVHPQLGVFSPDYGRNPLRWANRRFPSSPYRALARDLIRRNCVSVSFISLQICSGVCSSR
jgi:hypothetical protein